MDYRVEQLASAAGVGVDTVRFYQGRGLLDPPARVGRIAIYGDAHLERLRRIRSLLDQGFSLAQIAQLLDDQSPRDARRSERPLLEALLEQRVAGRSYTRAEFAAETGLPEALLAAAQSSGLVDPVTLNGEERFSESDVEVARAGLALLEAGLPLQELLAIAGTHVRNTQELVDAGIDLFDDYIRKAARDGGGGDREADDEIAEAFRLLLPQVTRLVALHFQRTLVNRALERLRASGDDAALERALAATRALEVAWR